VRFTVFHTKANTKNEEALTILVRAFFMGNLE
jgi:hypothetical protein